MIVPQWDGSKRRYWDVGDARVFRFSRQRCAEFLYALVACDGKIHDVFSLDVRYGSTIYANMKPHECAAQFRISLPVGAEAKFEELMGGKVLTDPPVVTVNKVMDRPMRDEP